MRGIVETRDGYLWIGTANGLARFDGVRFTSFDSANTPGFFSADVLGLDEDAQGGLWIHTRRGVFRLFRGRLAAMPAPEDGFNTGPGNLVRDWKGELWIHAGTNFARWNGEKLETIRMPEGPADVMHISPAPDGGFWFATSRRNETIPFGCGRPRHSKVRSGEWEVVLERSTISDTSLPAETNSEVASVARSLIERGISPQRAFEIANDYPVDRIKRKRLNWWTGS